MIINLDNEIKVGTRLQVSDRGNPATVNGIIISLEFAQGNVYQVARVEWDDGLTTNIRTANIEAKKESNAATL